MDAAERRVNVLRYGREEPLPQRVRLWAGPVSLVYEGGDLRYLTVAGREAIRRIYVAVRDPNWGTVPAELSDVRILRAEDRFEIDYTARHRRGDLDYRWEARITGEADGTIAFSMDGVALADFRSNRIGFCVLHPMACAGAECVVEHVELPAGTGAREEGRFPRCISPHQPFRSMRAISHRVSGDVWATVRLSGDVFEMEDQRNWTDASFKIYSRPLDLPFPFPVARGERIRQSVTLTVEGVRRGGMAVAPAEGAVAVAVGGDPVPLPALGLGVASHGRPLAAREVQRLRRLRPGYLFLDLDLREPTFAESLRVAWEGAEAVGVPLRVALTVSECASEELSSLLAALEGIRPRISAWFVHDAGRPTTSARTAVLARDALRRYAPEVPVGGGARAYFTELNRNRPPTDALDLLTYAITPQVHAFDNTSLVETPPAQAATVVGARRFADGLPIAINPVTLKPRFNPSATGPVAPPAPGEPPPQVDPRQASLLCAAWTVASLKRLALTGVESATYYETTGWRGVMEVEGGAPVPVAFPSISGGVFPVYHVLAAVGEVAGAEVLRAESSDSLRVEALALRWERRVRVLLANLSDRPQSVALGGLARPDVLWALDETNAAFAMRRAAVPAGATRLTRLEPRGAVAHLAPYATLVLEGGEEE